MEAEGINGGCVAGSPPDSVDVHHQVLVAIYPPISAESDYCDSFHALDCTQEQQHEGLYLVGHVTMKGKSGLQIGLLDLDLNSDLNPNFGFEAKIQIRISE